MIKNINIIARLFAACIILFILLHVFLNIFGKPILISRLEKATKRKVTIGNLSTSFPLGISIKNIEAQGLLKVDQIYAAGGMVNIFSGSINLLTLRIEHPVVTLEKPAVVEQVSNDPNAPGVPKDNKPAIFAPSVQRIKQKLVFLPRVKIGHLIINDGTIEFMDRAICDSGILVKAEKINVNITNLRLPARRPRITTFDIAAVMPWREGQDVGRISFKGWVNLSKKDIDAVLSIKDIDGVYLAPYYAAWISLENTRIEKAKLNFTSEIKGVNNDINAKCHLELADIVRTPRQLNESEAKEQKITDVVLDMFKGMDQGRVVVNFNIKTHLNQPQFGFNIIEDAVKEKILLARNNSSIKMRDVAAAPKNFLIGFAKGVADFSKAVVDGVFALGSGVHKTMEGSFDNESSPYSPDHQV